MNKRQRKKAEKKELISIWPCNTYTYSYIRQRRKVGHESFVKLDRRIRRKQQLTILYPNRRRSKTLVNSILKRGI
nr:MAG TPA: hypothetical protein [Caudoviricetes sp.]